MYMDEPEGMCKTEENDRIGVEQFPFCPRRKLGGLGRVLGKLELLLRTRLASGEEA